MRQISDYLSYFPAVEEPELSSEIYVIQGRERHYLFDAGNQAGVLNQVNLLCPKYVFISHFHKDHVGQLPQIARDGVYASAYTIGKIGCGEAVTHVEFQDGITLSFEEMVSTHSKGACILNLNHEITLLGDAVYMEKNRYNVTKLHDMIAFLEGLNTKYFICSHESVLTEKERLLEDLKGIYACRHKDDPYIMPEWFMGT